MLRLWLLVAALVIGLLLLRRALGRGRRPPPRRERGETPQTLVCADCGTRYDPDITGWVCPRCKK